MARQVASPLRPLALFLISKVACLALPTSGGIRWRQLLRYWASFLALALGLSQAPAADFAKNYETTGANTSVYATMVDVASNTYIAGTISGATVAIGNVTLARIGIGDAFVAKLDPSGNTIWARNFGGSGATVFPRRVTADRDGNFYASGTFSGASQIAARNMAGASDRPETAHAGLARQWPSPEMSSLSEGASSCDIRIDLTRIKQPWGKQQSLF